MDKFPKQPSEERDYPVNGADFLESTDTISSVLSTSVTVYKGAEDPITLEIYDTQYTATKVIFWLRGGIDRVTYKVEALIQTTEGRKVEHEFLIQVRDL